MADEVVRDVTEVLGGDDGSAELLQGVGVDLLDGLDQVVEAYRGWSCELVPREGSS
ncbi:hypothetical protein ACFSNO_29390 [Streptomyces cirratus]